MMMMACVMLFSLDTLISTELSLDEVTQAAALAYAMLPSRLARAASLETRPCQASQAVRAKMPRSYLLSSIHFYWKISGKQGREKHHSGKSTTMVIDQMGFNLYCSTKDCQFLVSLSKCTEILDSVVCTFSLSQISKPSFLFSSSCIFSKEIYLTSLR